MLIKSLMLLVLIILRDLCNTLKNTRIRFYLSQSERLSFSVACTNSIGTGSDRLFINLNLFNSLNLKNIYKFNSSEPLYSWRTYSDMLQLVKN